MLVKNKVNQDNANSKDTESSLQVTNVPKNMRKANQKAVDKNPES